MSPKSEHKPKRKEVRYTLMDIHSPTTTSPSTPSKFIDGGDGPFDPIREPWPSAVELAAAYIAEVRANGPEFMANVANAYGDMDMAYEIGYEVGEAWARFDGGIDWGTSPLVGDASDLCAEAAGLAIDAFRRELTR